MANEALNQQDTQRDTVVPGTKWEFDANVASCFDDMLARSIPSYDIMRDLCFKLGRHFAWPNSSIVDLGASRGEALRPFFNYPSARFYALEISEPMRRVMDELYKDNHRLEVMDYDLRKLNGKDFKYTPSLVLSVLTIQFTPIEYRQQIVDEVYNMLLKGGAFIFVEKVLGNSGALDELLVKEYYEFKHANGYSYEDIQRKRASLEGTLVPVTADWNVDLLKNAGFRRVDCFYRCLNFAGWIAIK